MCAAALAPQKICAAVKTVSDKNDCTHNVMIYEVEESNEVTIEDEVGKVLTEIEDKPVISNVVVLESQKPDSKHQVKFAPRRATVVFT